MPNPRGWLHSASAQTQVPAGQKYTMPARSTTTYSQLPQDPNAPDKRLILTQKCVYERSLPGHAYITAHITRLQKGFYDSPSIHDDRIDNVRFVAINFVFHPTDTTHRFTSAVIKISIHDRSITRKASVAFPPQIDPSANRRASFIQQSGKKLPKFLRYAPHLLYGALSPETLDWNFNLAGSLGVTQGPANASISPSGGVKSSYKIYKSMKIQGSVRTANRWLGEQYDVEDGELVWTLTENSLQKSGLPREFTFVMMLTKGDVSSDVDFALEIEPTIGSWYGTYPKWWLSRIWYQPLPKDPIDLETELGQLFGPSDKEEGFNFASLMGTFDDFVSLPGTTYSTSDRQAGDISDPSQIAQPNSTSSQKVTASPVPDTSRDLNVRVFLDGYRNSVSDPLPSVSSSRRHSSHSPLHVHSSSPVSSAMPNITKPRARPASAVYYPSPPTTTMAGTGRRPTSLILESSTTPLKDSNTRQHSQPQQQQRQQQQQRPLSRETEISEDLYTHPNSPISFGAATTPEVSRTKSLRHSRPRSGLTKEFERSSTPTHTPRSRTQPPVDQLTHRRRATIHDTVTTAGPEPRPTSKLTSPRKHDTQKRLPLPLASQSLTAPDLTSSRNSTATTIADDSPVPNTHAFPPSSYPFHNNIINNNTKDQLLQTRTPNPTIVDNIIQQEIEKYVRDHPELRSPSVTTSDSEGMGFNARQAMKGMDVGQKLAQRRMIVGDGGRNGEFVRVSKGGWQYLD